MRDCHGSSFYVPEKDIRRSIERGEDIPDNIRLPAGYGNNVLLAKKGL